MGFFSDLSKKATETCKNTGEKTNKIAKEMKLKSYISECKNKIEGMYAEIGKKVYEKHILGEQLNIETDLKDEIERIDTVAQRIESMNNEIRTLKNLKICEKCSSEIDLNARFCPKCGTKLEENIINQSEADNQMEKAEQYSENKPNDESEPISHEVECQETTNEDDKMENEQVEDEE